MTAMSYRVTRHSPLEFKLNWIVEQMLENGFMELIDRYSTFLIAISAISTRLRNPMTLSITPDNNIDASNFFPTQILEKIYFCYYLILLIAAGIFVAEIVYDRKKLIIQRIYRRIARKYRVKFVKMRFLRTIVKYWSRIRKD